MARIEQKNYSTSGLDYEDIIEQIRLILSYDGDVHKITLSQGNILAEYVVDDDGPPFGKIPENPAENLADVLSRVSMEHVSDQNEVDVDSLAVIASALVRARKALREGIAWITSDKSRFFSWMGVEEPIARLLGIPVHEVSSEALPKNKLILLCGKTSAVNLLNSDYGVVMDMGGHGG